MVDGKVGKLVNKLELQLKSTNEGGNVGRLVS